MKTSAFLSFAASLALPVLAWSQTVYHIGDFETGLDGWGISQIDAGNSPRVSLTQSTNGATSGNYSLQIQGNLPGSFQWATVKDLGYLGAGLDQIGSAPQVILSFDMTLLSSEWASAGLDWAQIGAIVYSSPDRFSMSELVASTNAGLIADTMNPGYPAGVNTNTFGGSYVTSVSWDITDLVVGATSADGWNELVFAINYSSDFTTGGSFYIDNVTITAVPEPSAYTLWLGLGVVGWTSMQRRRRSQTTGH